MPIVTDYHVKGVDKDVVVYPGFVKGGVQHCVRVHTCADSMWVWSCLWYYANREYCIRLYMLRVQVCTAFAIS